MPSHPVLSPVPQRCLAGEHRKIVAAIYGIVWGYMALYVASLYWDIRHCMLLPFKAPRGVLLAVLVNSCSQAPPQT